LVTASQFSKRYAFLIMTPCLYAMTMYDKGLERSLENSHIESSAARDSSWSPRICAKLPII